MPKTKGSGGKRTGSGRKKDVPKLKPDAKRKLFAVSFRITDEIAEWLSTAVKKSGCGSKNKFGEMAIIEFAKKLFGGE